MKTSTLTLVLTCGCLCGSMVPLWAADVGRELVGVDAIFEHGPRKPSAVPILPGLNIGRSIFDNGAVRGPGDPPYEPVDGDSLAIHNGPRALHHLLTAGVWHLRVGDRPRLGLSHRGSNGVYALPGMLPDLGVTGSVRLAVETPQGRKWLDEFDSIDAVLAPGSARWTCTDKSLEVTIELAAYPFVNTFGFAAVAQARSGEAKAVTLIWTFDGAELAATETDFTEFSTGTYTRIFTGLAEPGATMDRNQAVVRLDLKPGQPAWSRYVCVWGYSNYDHQAVDDAYRRLEFKPFADPKWVDEMKKKWFEHWIGRGLKPREKFLAVRHQVDDAIEESKQFSQRQRGRLRIKTPDPRFDTAINNTAATLRKQFEYPAFIHGVGWTKYGKINSGYYGCEASGYHEEVADSLKFISGTLDNKGRPRYFEPTFAICHWSEEQNFYYVEQVWYHYCWTGDREFLKAMWPSVRRVLEQGIFASDPDGDGIMTAYYETWNGDGHGRGGRSAIWTGMAIAALRAAEQMADILGGRLYDPINASQAVQNPRPPVIAEYYRKLRKRSEEQFEKQLWSKRGGTYASAEHNGVVRPHAESMEVNYHVWRGVGQPMRNYMSLRYLHETLHLRPAKNVTLELCSDWWPVMWSHHYVANGDTMATFASACKAGAVDDSWPAMKTVTETIYNGGTGTLFHGLLNDGRGAGMNLLAELEPMVMVAVVDGMFGAAPHFGDNLLVLRPNLPSHWDHAEIATGDFTYAYAKTDTGVSLDVTTPVNRKLRAELPVQAEVREVSLNGKPTDFTVDSAVGSCRVVVAAPPGKSFRIEIKTGPVATCEGDLVVLDRRPAEFLVRGASVTRVLDPQEMLQNAKTDGRSDGGSRVTITPATTGKPTVFLELQAGKSTWLHPLKLDVRPAWNIVERFVAAHNSGGPSVASPRVDPSKKTLRLELQNNATQAVQGSAVITVAGVDQRIDVDIPPRATAAIELSLAEQWDRLSPGRLPVTVQLAGQRDSRDAVNWEVGREAPEKIAQRLMPLDLRPYYNVEITKLYSQEFFWRHDYTGCGIGIDWRDPLPLRDEKGYVVMASPINQFEYQSLPEGFSRTASFAAPEFGPELNTAFGVSFSTGTKPLTAGAKGNILALAATEPYAQLPSRAVLKLPRPMQLEKVYLLTANLTKTVKCYFPGAEVVVHYADGEDQIVELVPPYTMSNFGQIFCPTAFAIPFGTMQGDCTPLRMGGCQPHLAVSDIMVDRTRQVTAIELRCVASETIFGVMGISLLQVTE